MHSPNKITSLRIELLVGDYNCYLSYLCYLVGDFALLGKDPNVKDRQKPPWLIQGGMGIAISNWALARSVSLSGQLGVVSGTGIADVFARRLQDCQYAENLQDVLDSFPLQDVVEQTLVKYGKKRLPNEPYLNIPMLSHRNVVRSQDLLVLATYVEVSLAKAGHEGIVGINLLTKIQLPTLATLFGAILAGVDYVLMGAGVPTQIPGVLDQLSLGEKAELSLNLSGDIPLEQKVPTISFDPKRFISKGNLPPSLIRPRFIGIVSSHVLASALATRSNGQVDGFVVESPIAGGHNAPPRGHYDLDEKGNPIYRQRDKVNFDSMVKLGLPFWIAGGITHPKDVEQAFELGAAGVQVGTLFAYCQESGMDPSLKRKVIQTLKDSQLEVKTSTKASSTGYPFKVVSIEKTLSDKEVYDQRKRICDIGYLRQAYVKQDGGIGYRCPGEPIDQYVKKGGTVEDSQDRLCLCNALMASCGLGQFRADGLQEPPVVTSGDSLDDIRFVLKNDTSYRAQDVIRYLAGQ